MLTIAKLFCKKYYNKKNVVGIGTGLKVKDGKITNEKCILFGVCKKEEISHLEKKDIIPTRVCGVKTDVVEVGELEHLNWRGRHRPLKIGASCAWKGLTACLPEGEYVYSNNGVQEINLCFDSVLGKNGENQDVKNTFKRNVKQQNIVEIKPHYLLPVRMTREHPVLVQFFNKKRKKKTIDKWYGARALYDEFKRGEINPYLKVKKLKCGDKKIDPLFAEFIGWYISEGSTRIKEIGMRGSCYRIEISNSDITNVERIKYLATELFGVSPVVEKRIGRPSNISGVRFQNKKLALWLRENCGHLCQNKKIPDIFFNADKETLEALLIGLIRGDGWKYRNGFGYVTTSKLLAHQLQLVFLKIGIVPSGGVYEQNGKGSLKRYQFSIDLNPNRRYYKEDNDFWYLPIKDIELKNFAGYVYNIQTPDETFAVPFIVHNCSAGLPVYSKDGIPYLLMNKHCIIPDKNRGVSLPGDEVLNPSPSDSGTLQDRIGEVTEIAFPMSSKRKDNIDVCLVKLDDEMKHEDVVGTDYIHFTRELKNDILSRGGDLLKTIFGGGRTLGTTKTSSPIISVDFNAGVWGVEDGKRVIRYFPNSVLTLNQSKEGGPCVLGGDSSSIRFIDRMPLVQTFAGSNEAAVFNQVQRSLDWIYNEYDIELFLEPQTKPEGWVALGSWLTISGTEITIRRPARFRKEAGTQGEIIKILLTGDKLKMVGKSVIKGNHFWVKCYEI